jgi:hypothetical protein
VLWTDLRILVTDTGRLWWRLLPTLLAIWVLGWLGRRLFSTLAVIAGDLSPWLTMIIFPLGILSELVAIVLILQACGRELGIRGLIPSSELVDDDRDAGVARLLAITLLPFIGIYAAFGYINDAAYSLYVQQLTRYGVISDAPTVLGLLNGLATQHTWRLLMIVVTLYVARRLLDLAHEQTGWRPLGVIVALLETFFILLVVLGGVRVWQLGKIWILDRAFVRWIETALNPLEQFFALLRLNLPDLVVRLYDFVVDEVWPVLADTLVQPLAWLAVAAIIYGSNVMSLADLNRTVRDRLPGTVSERSARRAARRTARRAGRQERPPGRGLRRVGTEAKEAFFGDVDDKYLPTFHALRLVIRSGPAFLGSFVLVYAAVRTLGNYLQTSLRLVTGGHDLDFWLVYDPLIELIRTLPVELLRLCLLAVAFRRCLELFGQRYTAGPVQTLPLSSVGGERFVRADPSDKPAAAMG